MLEGKDHQVRGIGCPVLNREFHQHQLKADLDCHQSAQNKLLVNLTTTISAMVLEVKTCSKNTFLKFKKKKNPKGKNTISRSILATILSPQD